MRNYARQLTKEELMQSGITEITTDGHVFKGLIDITPKEPNPNTTYFQLAIYEFDDNGKHVLNELSNGTKVWKQRSIGLHRAIYAWFYGFVPEGYVVDHINNQHDKLEDYNLDNLQLLLPGENVWKEREHFTKQIKCNMHKPRKFYEDKLNYYTNIHNVAKECGDYNYCHKLRTNIGQCRARLRYWDAHKAEYEAYINEQKIKNSAKEEWHKSVNNKRRIATLRDYYRAKDDGYAWHRCCDIIKNYKNYDEEFINIYLDVCDKLGF